MKNEPRPTRADQVTVGHLRAYEVVTPNYERYSGSSDPPEPSEYGCDYRLVYTTNARRAVILAVRAWWRANGLRFRWSKRLPWWKIHGLIGGWVENNYSDGVPPWKGVRAGIMATEEWIEANYPIVAGNGERET